MNNLVTIKWAVPLEKGSDSCILTVNYSKISVTRTAMVRLPWQVRSHFWVLRTFFPIARKKVYRDNLGICSYLIMYGVWTHQNRLIEAILISTLNIPLFYIRSKRHPYIIPICLLTSMARTTHMSNKFPWFQRCSRQRSSTVFSFFSFLSDIISCESSNLITCSASYTLKSLALWRLNHQVITKTCLYNFDPLKPHFYIVKLGFTGVYIIFLISAQNIDCGYSLEPPRKEYPQSMFWAEIWKIFEFFIWKFASFWL